MTDTYHEVLWCSFPKTLLLVRGAVRDSSGVSRVPCFVLLEWTAALPSLRQRSHLDV